MGRLDPGLRVAFPPGHLHDLQLGLAGVVLTREEGLVVLGRQVHVVVGERLFVGLPREALVLRSPE